MVAPRYELVPAGRGKKRAEIIIELAAATGQPLDDWQQRVIRGACKTTGKRQRWAAPEVGLNMPRQNGKGSILQARELAGALYFPEERLIVHSAHEFKTSREAFMRMEDAIEEAGLQSELKRGPRGLGISRSHGEEGFKFANNSRIGYSTRTAGAGRGITGDLIVLDEAMMLPETALRALFMTVSARTMTGNPQVWYTGSAVDQLTMDHGVVFARLRKRGLAGAKGLAYFEWSAEAEIDELETVLDDPEQWQKANPAIGVRIQPEWVAQERESLDARSFGVERLGVGDWPPTELAEHAAIDFERWLSLTDEHSMMVDPVVFAFDVTPDRGRATIAVAGKRPDGRFHIEVAKAQPGTGWLPERLASMVERHQPEAVVYDPASPAASLIRPLNTLGVEPEKITAQEYGAACGLIFDLIEQAGLRHLGQHELAAAVRNASRRPLGEAWAWSRRLSAGDISPLVASTLALWRAHTSLESVYESRGLVAV